MSKDYTLQQQRVKDLSRLVNRMMQEHGPTASVSFSVKEGQVTATVAEVGKKKPG